MKYFVAYTYMINNGIGLGNIEIDTPHEISSINDVRTIEEQIKADLIRQGKEPISRVVVTNYIRLRDGDEADTLRQRVTELEAEIERMKDEHDRDTYQED